MILSYKNIKIKKNHAIIRKNKFIYKRITKDMTTLNI